MGAIFVTDSKFGMDRRRDRVAGVPGTLWTGKNVQITRGGDIERPKRFTPFATLPAGLTFGLAALRGQLFTFGSLAAGSITLPNGVQYQRCVAPTGAAMTGVLDVRTPNGQLYVIARYADGNIYHFLDGTRVTDWDTLATAAATIGVLAAYLADLASSGTAVNAQANGSVITLSARTPGTPFTVTRATTDVGGTNDQDIVLTTTQANVAAQADVRATSAMIVLSGSTGQVTNITANAVSLLQATVTWTGDTTSMAAALATQINNKTAVSGYSAITAGPNITLSAPIGVGAAANAYAVTNVVTGDVVLSTPGMSGGITAVAAVTQIVTAALTGTFEKNDVFTLTVNGTACVATGNAAATGTSLMVLFRRVWSPSGSLWNYSKINTFNNWSDATAASGAGFLNISNEAEGSERLVGGGVYINFGAIFSRRNTRVYNLSTDATTFALAQTIDGTGTLASRSIYPFGAIDLFFLDETGIRSLKARDALNAAFVDDIGTAVDTVVRAHVDTLPFSVVQRAVATIEPKDGRFWLALGNRIYVLSYFPKASISAWTYFEPGFSIDDFARSYNQMYVRSGDQIYLYGGSGGNDYPLAGETPALVELPFMTLSPPTPQNCTGVDIAATNEWTMDLLFDPTNENVTVRAGTLDGITYGNADTGMVGRFTHVAAKLTCVAAGAAKIANITIWHDGGEPAT